MSQTPIKRIEIDSVDACCVAPKRMTPNNPNKDISGKNALVVNLEVVIEGIQPPMINPNPNRPSTLLETMGVQPIFLIAINGS